MISGESEQGLIGQQIEKWIREHVALPDIKLHGKCDRVVLRHVNIERKVQGDVKAFPTRLEDGAEEEGIAPLLRGIADAAQGDADELNQGVQSYVLCAYYPGDKGYVPRRYFRVAPSDVEIQRDLSPSEPPTEKGLVAQMQRHVEAIQRTSTVATGHLFQTMQAELRRLSEMNEKFAQQQIDFMVLTQDLIDNSHSRRLKEKESETNLAVKENIIGKLESLVPVILNRLAGKQILPEENRSMMLMSALLENMTDAQQTAFYEGLSDSQKMALAEILHEYELAKSKMSQQPKISQLVTKNTLPPPQPRSDDILVPESETTASSTTLSLRDRLKQPLGPSEDPKIRQLEGDASTFASRFRDMLAPTKPTPGEKT